MTMKNKTTNKSASKEEKNYSGFLPLMIFGFNSETTEIYIVSLIVIAVLIIAATILTVKLIRNLRKKKKIKTQNIAVTKLDSSVESLATESTAIVANAVKAESIDKKSNVTVANTIKVESVIIDENLAVNKPITDQTDLVLTNIKESSLADELFEEDDLEDEDLEVIKEIDAKQGKVIIIRYRKSFLARLKQSPDTTKEYYSVIKNALLQYNLVKPAYTWNYENFNIGRKQIAKINVSKKTLSLYLPLVAEDFAETKYHVERTESKKYAQVPTRYKINSSRRVKYALDLIKLTAEKMELSSTEKESINYAKEHPFETTEALIEKLLIKENIHAEAQLEYMKRLQRRLLRNKTQKVVYASEVDRLLSSEVAASIIGIKNIKKSYQRKSEAIINLDVISLNYKSGETVTLASLIEKGLINKKTTCYKVLARGKIDKPLTIEANDISIAAAKMILLTGGNVIKLV